MTIMLRLLSIALVGFAVSQVDLATAAVFASRDAGMDQRAPTLFPGIVFGDSSDHFGYSNGLSALADAVSESLGNPASDRPRRTVASLYGEAGDPKTAAAEQETETSISVVVGGRGGNPDPIQVFTGANTSTILTQLFSGILNVDDETFAHRRIGRGLQTRPSTAGAGGGATGGTPLTSGNFLATQSFSGQTGWFDSSPTRFNEPLPVIEEKPPARTSDMLKVVLALLNPYFYGALLIILLFSVAWSMRSRFSQFGDTES
jgi:hypothetical protein